MFEKVSKRKINYEIVNKRKGEDFVFYGNNQKLKNAVTLGLISNDEYNILGGYDVNQTMGLNPFMTGITSGLYNVYQTIKGDQPASEIYGDVKRNVQGSFGLPEDLQAKYDNIMSMSSDELTNQLADLNLANQRRANSISTDFS